LVGLAAATAQLPVLTPDIPLLDAASAIRNSFSGPPTPAADEFCRLLVTSFAASLPGVHDMPVSDFARALFPLYEQWQSDANQN